MENRNNINEIDIRKIVRVVLEHWWWFAIGVGFFVVLGLAYYLKKNPSWTTDASIVLRQKTNGLDQLGAVSMLGLTGNAAAEDEVVVLSSRGLTYQAIDALNLWDATYVRRGLRWQGEFYNPALRIDYVQLTDEAQKNTFVVTVKPTKNGYKVKTKMGHFNRFSTVVPNLGEPIETAVGTISIHPNRTLSPDTAYRLIHSRKEVVVYNYCKAVNISLHKKESNIIKLSTTSPLPSRDKEFLLQLIEQYNLNAVVDKNLIASNTASFIEERLNIITAELSDAENALSEYKEQNNIADLEAQAKIFLEESNMEQRKMVEIETQLSLVEYVRDFLKDETKRNNLIPSNIGIEDAALASSLSEYNTLQLQRMRIMRTATDDNPVVNQMSMQLATMRQNIIATIESVQESLNIRKRNLSAQDTKFNRQIKEAPEQQREYIRVVRQQQIKEKLYVYLYEKREENALMLAATSMPAKILDVPQYNVRSRSPKLFRLLFFCGVLGIVFPAVLLYLFILFNDSISDVKDFEKKIRATMLVKLVHDNTRSPYIAIREGESTAIAELFRLLRTNLRFVIPAETKAPVIVVTSCVNGEGKTFVAANTALALAMLDKKVALVGMDIRKPILSEFFGLSQRGRLTDYLTDSSMKLDDIVIPGSGHKNLDVIPCGTIAPNPSELLQTKRVDDLFTELRKRYDYIIVDTAPVAAVSDTYMLDRVADLNLFVCRYKLTPMEMVDYINDVIEKKQMHNVACVLNDVKTIHTIFGNF